MVTVFLGVVTASLFEEKLASIIFYSDEFSSFLYKWQTLVSGGMAVVAAIVSIYILNRHHKESLKVAENRHNDALEAAEKRHNDVVRRKALSLRAHLPDILDSLTGYCRLCLGYITEGAKGKLPEYDRNKVDILKECIQYMDADASNELYDLVKAFQIHNSKLNGYTNKESVYCNVVKLNAQILNVFEYARGEKNKIKPFCENSENMSNSLASLFGLRYGDSRKYVENIVSEKLKKKGGSC